MTRQPQAPPSAPDRLASLLGGGADEMAGGGGASAADDGGAGADTAGGRHRGGVPLLSMPQSLRSLEVRVGVRAARGLLAVALVVVLVLAGRWAWAVRSAVPAPAGEVVTERADDAVSGAGPTQVGERGPDPAPSTSTAVVLPAPSPPPAHLLVHVAGEVGAPGVVRVPPGARVVDAITAAGGLTQEADQALLNLARPVVDGEQLWVGRPGEAPPASAGLPPARLQPAEGPSAGGSVAAGGGGSGSVLLLDLNTATQADLEGLPGIGPVTAGHILAWRDAHGRFTRVDELLEVSGIGERTFARLEPLVTVGG